MVASEPNPAALKVSSSDTISRLNEDNEKNDSSLLCVFSIKLGSINYTVDA